MYRQANGFNFYLHKKMNEYHPKSVCACACKQFVVRQFCFWWKRLKILSIDNARMLRLGYRLTDRSTQLNIKSEQK